MKYIVLMYFIIRIINNYNNITNNNTYEIHCQGETMHQAKAFKNQLPRAAMKSAIVSMA